jgi:hypothetical protein
VKILDSNKNLLAQIIKPFDGNSPKNFFTENDLDFQAASFQLEKDEKIERHIHNNQERIIQTTSEALIVTEGLISVEIYDMDLNFIQNVNVTSGEVILLFAGGHSLSMLEHSKFVEIKQGPYNEKNDKKRF